MNSLAQAATKKGLKLTIKIIGGLLFSTFGFYLILFSAIMLILISVFSSKNTPVDPYSGLSLEVENYRGLMTDIAIKYDVKDYVDLLLAIMQTESAGKGNDPMQSSECGFNTKFPRTPNAITEPDYSIECGVQQFKAAKEGASVQSPVDFDRLSIAIQAYNYGLAFVKWALENGGYTYNNAIYYQNTVMHGRGDSRYVPKVYSHYSHYSGGDTPAMDQETYNKLMNEAIKYIGLPYVFGGTTPAGFDCSGYVCFVLKHSGVKDVPRLVAQQLYDMCQKISDEEAKPGDLIFYEDTYPTVAKITHVGFYVGNGKMLDSSTPTLGYHDIWQKYTHHYGRIPLP